MPEPETTGMDDAHTRGHEHAAPMQPGRTGPLADVRIIDLTQALAGPYCTMILADMGADVIKVEPPGGDMARFNHPYTESDNDRFYGGYFGSINRNKRSIVLNLKSPADRDTLLTLVDTADVLVENYTSGVMDRLGLSYETLHARNPKLVYAAIRGFGDPRTGESPYASWPAFDVVAQAMGGLISYTGEPGGKLVSAGPSVGDLYPATMCAVGVLGALHHARATGNGQFVDVAMTDAVMALCESLTYRYSYTGEVQAPRGSRHPSLAPFELYATVDGDCAIAAPTAGQWRFLCDVMGRPDLVDDPRTSSANRRAINRPFVTEVVEGWTRPLRTEQVIARLAGRVPVGPVNNAPALFASEHVRSREMLVAVEHPGSDRPVVVPNTPIRFTETKSGVYRRPPKLGEHGQEIRNELDTGERS